MYNPLHLRAEVWAVVLIVYGIAIFLFLKHVTADEYRTLGRYLRWRYDRWLFCTVIVAVTCWPLVLLGFAIAGCLMVADQKNRSRAWAATAFVLGPLPLIALLLLPPLPDTNSLHIDNPLP